MEPPSLTIGIEEEYQLVDRTSRALDSYITHFRDPDRAVLREQATSELLQSVLEVTSRVCETPAEVREELARLRRASLEEIDDDGLRIVAAGTHPFSTWYEQDFTPEERYVSLQEDLQAVAHRNLIFGLHVHVGIEDEEFRVWAMNRARNFLPELLALSASSPFWQGRDTGLRSYRSVVWRSFPRTGVPRRYASWDDLRGELDLMREAGAMRDPTRLWWDIRPNWNYPTLEFRVCDISPRIEEVVCLAALVQALVHRLWQLRTTGDAPRPLPAALVEENKWRAARYGLDGDLVDFERRREVPARERIRWLVDEFLAEALEDLGTREAAGRAHGILEEGTSADRQLAVFRETGSLEAVVDHLMEETSRGVH